MRRSIFTVLVVAIVGAVALPAGSVPRAKPKPKPSTSTTTTTWPALPAFNGNLAWSDCGDGFECGTLTVPVDWQPKAGSGDTVPLAMIRHPAESPSDRIGALVVNYGGPGESGVAYLAPRGRDSRRRRAPASTS